MLLTIDVGNTNISMGILDGEKIVGRYRLMTQTTRTSDEYGFFITTFLNTLQLKATDITGIIISSVVPKLMYSLTSAVIKYLHQKPMIVTNEMQMDIKLDTEAPRSIGADRIVNTTYAWNTFHRSCIIVDFGTATTYDYIDQNGVFRYVVIQPGLGISLNALTSMTAKLPEIEIVKPKSVLGTNTIEGMQAGVVYGYIGSVEHIIKTMKKELSDPSCMVVATGGLGKIIASETDEINAYDADIAFKGMKILYDINKGKDYENL